MMKYCENHLSSASMVFFSHKVDICNNKDVIDGPERAGPTPASATSFILGPRLQLSPLQLVKWMLNCSPHPTFLLH